MLSSTGASPERWICSMSRVANMGIQVSIDVWTTTFNRQSLILANQIVGSKSTSSSINWEVFSFVSHQLRECAMVGFSWHEEGVDVYRMFIEP